ncbi:hypothetical protein BD410DRAFT_795168 [Rickenella mellea]|uniref:F-box domain-containing protein n=1 Tax=Rickenella mellea TaxID=50990 RepID=A0A4Y7PP31_9AGAM|nr:hypothetical protein BD410DRAFT_795168 [Rickenella mellea]
MDHISEEKTEVPSSGNLSTPIVSLAPELLCSIFSHCVSNDQRKDAHSRDSIRCLFRAPLLLGRVCSRWRDVSISSPELWSSFAVGDDRGRPPDADLAKDLKATKHWISRSGSRPLSIRISYKLPRTYETMVRPILESLVSQSWRWKNVTLDVPSEFEAIIVAPFRNQILPQLVEFDSISKTPGSGEFILSSAPRLRVLSRIGPIDFSGGVHGIKQIRMDYDHTRNSRPSLDDLFSCFTHCPLLEDLFIFIYTDDEWRTRLPDELPSIIELSHLTHLYLYCMSGIDPCRLFDRLYLPALVSLNLHMWSSNASDPEWRQIQTMLAHSRPPLQTLAFSLLPMSERTMIGCLSYVPTLTSFHVYGTNLTDSILGSLTVDEADTNASKNLCPLLERIEFEDAFGGGKCHFSEHAMTRMIISRRKFAKNTPGTGMALKWIKASFQFDRIRSNPDIAECLNNGLRLVYCT